MSITATWLGHSTFTLRLDDRRLVLIDPWVAQNPACPPELKALDRIDLMAITHGHFDHIADAIPLAQQHEPQIAAIFELGHWLERKGVPSHIIHTMNKGGTAKFGDIELTMVHADHSCGILDGDSIVYGGEATGFVIRIPGAPVIYHAGDTAVFGDMAIVRELYQPEVAMLPIGDNYTMSPKEAAKAAELLQPKILIPMHFGTFPTLTGTPQMLIDELDARGLGHIEVRAMEPGESMRL